MPGRVDETYVPFGLVCSLLRVVHASPWTMEGELIDTPHIVVIPEVRSDDYTIYVQSTESGEAENDLPKLHREARAFIRLEIFVSIVYQ